MPYIIVILLLIFAVFYKQEVIKEIKYVNRQTGKIEVEKVAGEAYLKWLYYNPLGKISAKTISSANYTEAYGVQLNTNRNNDFTFINEANGKLTIGLLNDDKSDIINKWVTDVNLL